MPENCEQTECRALAKLEQEVKDIRERNGSDHREFREQIQKIERDEARQEGRLDNITTMLTDIKGDNKEIIGKLTPLSAKMDRVDSLAQDLKAMDGELDGLKAKPGKRWESLVEKALWAVAAAVIAFLLAKIGL